MTTVVIESDELMEGLIIPAWVTDRDSFCRWAHSEEFPETGRICYLNGEVWVNMSKEQVFSDVLAKTRITAVLSELVEANHLGLFLGDGVFLSNAAADFATNPDAVFVSTAGLQDRVRLLEGREGGYVELEGSPDMVLEVVSRSSVRKDTQILRRAYWEAGIREYWLVDARPQPLHFDILRYTPKGYRATPRKDGWIKSALFGRSFRLTSQPGPLGHPEFSLALR